MILKQRALLLKSQRSTTLAVPSSGVCHAHSWTPATNVSVNSVARLAPLQNYRLPHCDELASSLVGKDQALYGHLVISNLLNPALQSTIEPESEGGSLGSQHNPDPQDGDDISDQEWEIRTGRAIYILQQTLPDFFTKGLISSLEVPTSKLDSSPPSSSSGTWLKQVLGLSDTTDTTGTDGVDEESVKLKKEDMGSIYSPRVRLKYTSPIPLPPPFPKMLYIEGLHLYIASSVFLRHTLNALYTDLSVELKRVRVEGPGISSNLSGRPGSSFVYQLGWTDPPTGNNKPKRKSREKCFVVGLSVIGTARVSKAPAQWDVNCTYTFSPTTGLILQHSVDSIEPAPTQALFEALGKFGLLGDSGTPGGASNL